VAKVAEMIMSVKTLNASPPRVSQSSASLAPGGKPPENITLPRQTKLENKKSEQRGNTHSIAVHAIVDYGVGVSNPLVACFPSTNFTYQCK